MIAIILGGAPAVWTESAAAKALLGERPHIIVAANLAGIHYDGHLEAFCSLHADLLPGWLAERAGQGFNAPRAFSPSDHWGPCEVIAERWPGSSGLFALQIALTEMRASAAILCGMPLQTDAGHFSQPGPWAGVADYRRAFAAALPVIGARARSMGGWTASLFGQPTPEWVEAADNLKPMGLRRPKPRIRPMFKVENTTDESQRFQAINPDGGFINVVLDPGQSGEYEIDHLQGRFQPGGTLKATPVSADAKAAVKASAELYGAASEAPPAKLVAKHTAPAPDKA